MYFGAKNNANFFFLILKIKWCNSNNNKNNRIKYGSNKDDTDKIKIIGLLV